MTLIVSDKYYLSLLLGQLIYKT